MGTHLRPVSKGQIALAQDDDSCVNMVGLISFIIDLLAALDNLFQRKAAQDPT